MGECRMCRKKAYSRGLCLTCWYFFYHGQFVGQGPFFCFQPDHFSWSWQGPGHVLTHRSYKWIIGEEN